MNNIITNPNDFNPADVINANERFLVRKRQPPKVDTIVSKLVGRTVLVNDPKLIKLVAKWKQSDNKTDQPDERPDNYFEDPAKVKELKDTFS